MAKQKKLPHLEETVRNKKRKSDEPEEDTKESFLHSLKEETVQGVFAIVCFLITIFLFLSAFEKAGRAGHFVYHWFSKAFGIGYYLLPLITLVLGIEYLKNLNQKFDKLKLVGATFFLISSLGIIHIANTLYCNTQISKVVIGTPKVLDCALGGFFGSTIAWPLVQLFESTASLVFLSALLIASLLITFNSELNLKKLLFFKREKKKEEDEEEDLEVTIAEEEPVKVKLKKEEVSTETKPEEKPVEKKESRLKVALGLTEDDELGIKNKPSKANKDYAAPPLSLLERDKGKPVVGDVKAHANIIQRTLKNFGIDVEMDEVSIGPSVTRYALKPAEGVKLARIVGLQNDLSLALAAHPLRIEAPIPGKSLVGIEIPNTTKTTVGLGTLFSSDEFQNSDKPLLVGLGKGISGKSHFVNIAKMPHLLIAGTTGSGKSVTIHALIVSLLYRKSPEQLKFIMIDPKRVELTLYNKIPHLLTPVITDAKKAILALKWAAKEMDRRYDILQDKGVRDIDSYHKTVLGPSLSKIKIVKDGEPDEVVPTLDPMPYMVIIIDELADIMQTYPRELEAAIVRLAQMSRAVGIHLILSTQRPSVNVITGLIKANIPSRLALQVASQIDSRTILDMPGAEKLLGAGDMLFLGGEMSKPQRIQCAYISEAEVKAVAKYLTDTYQDELTNEINLTDNAVTGKNSIFESTFEDQALDGDGDDDELYEQAKAVVIEAGKASTSYIQRKLRVGYARAARLIDILEERGVIGPGDGAKPRSVIGGGDKQTQNPEMGMPENEEKIL